MRKLNDITYADGKHYLELACDSSEIASLPTTGVCDGSSAFTTDTAALYVFNEESAAWVNI